MLTRSRVIAGASALAGEPPDEALPGGVPMHLRYETVADIETELLNDLTQSVQNRMLAKTTVQLGAGQREFSLNSPGMEDPVYVSLSFSDGSNEIPDDVSITNTVLINSQARDHRRSVAFYGDKPQRGMLSWNPTGNEVLTVWFDRSPDTDPSVDQSTFTITDAYVPLVKNLLAAQMLELMGKPIGAMLTARIAKGLKQWEKFARNGKQQGVVEKTTYRRDRYGIRRDQYESYPGRVRFE